MKYFLSIVFVFINTAAALAQNAGIRRTDSLIKAAKTDTGRVNNQVSRIAQLTEVNLDSSINYGLAVIQEAKKINYELAEANARGKLAFSYCFKGEYQLAGKHMDTARSILVRLNDSAGLGKMYLTYGSMYGMQSKYDSSIYFFDKSIQIAELKNDRRLLELGYQNIAVAYQMQSNFARALSYMQKGLTMAEETNNLTNQAYLHLNMGIAYRSVNEKQKGELALLKAINLSKKEGIKNVELYSYVNLSSLYQTTEQNDLSFEYAMKAANLAKETGDPGTEATSLSWAAHARAHQKDFKTAEELGRKAITLAASSNQPLNIYQTYTTMGSVLSLQNRYKESIPYFEKGFAALKDADIYDIQIGQSYFNLAEAYEKTGNYQQALINYKLSSKIKDSITGKDNVRRSTQLDMDYEFNKKQELLKAQQDKKDAVTHAQQVTLVIGLALTVMLAGFAFYAYKGKSRTNAQLKSQKEEIEHTLSELKAVQTQLIQSEKMASLGELTAGIAHEIQNPLNFVNNFSELNAELIKEMNAAIDKGDLEEVKEIARDISGNEEKISHHGKRADGIVKGMLQHSRSSNGLKEPTDINVLADEYLRLAFHGLRAKDKTFNALLKTDFDPSVGKINVVSQDIGRVILNLITNAFYAVSEKNNENPDSDYEPTVFVSTKKSGNRYTIKVRDNGKGIPEKIREKIFQPFFTTKPTGQGTGLGLSLSYDIITKGHGGEIKVESKDGEFTEFTINLPV